MAEVLGVFELGAAVLGSLTLGLGAPGVVAVPGAAAVALVPAEAFACVAPVACVEGPLP